MLGPPSDPAYLLPPLISASVAFVFMVLVWLKGHRGFSSRIFCGLLLSIGLWSLFTFGMRSSSDIHLALPWDRALTVPAFAMWVFFYHFTITYTETKGRRYSIIAAYALLAVAAALAPTDLLVREMSLEHYGYAPVIGPGSYLLFAATFLLIAGGTYNLIRAYGVTHLYEERNHLLYLAIAVVFPITGAILDSFTDLPPASIPSLLIFSIICSIAMLKYHLLDICIVIRKSLVYILTSIIIAIPYVSLIYMLHYIFEPKLTPWWLWGLIILMLAIVLRPLYGWAQQIIDRLFYRDRYDYLRELERFSWNARSITDIEKLGSTMLEMISGALRTSSICLMLPSEDKHDFIVTSSTGMESPPAGIALRDISPLVKWLDHHEDILISEQLDIIPQLQSFLLAEKNSLKRLGAKLYVPMKNDQGKLSAILILGEKLSQQSYSREDKQLLKAVAGQMAMAIEKARLYDEALRVRQNLEKWLESMTDGVMIVDTDYTIQFMNRAAMEKLGSRVGEKCWEAYAKDTVCSGCPVQNCIHGNMDSLYYSASIGEREYDIAAAPLANPDGSLHIIEVIRDVTERKQAEESLRESEEKLRCMFESVSDGVVVTDLNSIIVNVNDRLLEMHRFSSRNEVMGKHVSELVAPFDCERAIVAEQKVLEKGFVSDVEVSLLRMDGSVFLGELSMSLLKDASGNPVGFITTAREITERKQAEEALRESEERYRALIRLGGRVGEAVIMVEDTEEIVGLHTFASAEWSHITGYSKKELLAMSFFHLVHPKDRVACLGRHHRRRQGQNVPGLYEITIVRKDGTEVPIEITAAVTTYKGQPANVGYIRDITERKQAEEALRESEEKEKQLHQELNLSHRLASIGELAAGVAHEVNNPLTGILGFSQRLLRKSTDEAAIRDLERIHNEAQRAAKVVQNLLTFARRREIKKEYLDANETLASALELRAYELRTSNIELAVELTPDLPKVMADFHQMQNVFLNIILNAEQAMVEAKGGGKLTVKTQKAKGYIGILFTDDGPGISAEHLDKLFDPFFTTREERGGTGLGLSVCHGIVTEHGGKIYAKSKPGKGTTFAVELPLATEYPPNDDLP